MKTKQLSQRLDILENDKWKSVSEFTTENETAGIHFIPRCHSEIGALKVEYKPEGHLTISCRVCDQFVCEIKVAEK